MKDSKGVFALENGADAYRRFLEGDEKGLEEIITEYKDGLILYLNGYVSNLDLAEELAEDTFVRLFTKKPKNKGGASFKTWLYTIGRNIALDALRKMKRRREEPLETHYDLADEENLEENYLREERKIAVHKAMNNLRPEYREVLWLTYFEDLSNKETAEILKKKVHAVEATLSRARAALKKELEKEGFIYENE